MITIPTMKHHCFRYDSSNGCVWHCMQATQAYLVGNKALAKELGAKGRQHSDQMKAAHAAASENIFLQRNTRNASSVVSNKNGTCTHCSLPSVCIWMHVPHLHRTISGALMLCACHCLDVQLSCNEHLAACSMFVAHSAHCSKQAPCQ